MTLDEFSVDETSDEVVVPEEFSLEVCSSEDEISILLDGSVEDSLDDEELIDETLELSVVEVSLEEGTLELSVDVTSLDTSETGGGRIISGESP